MRASIWKKIPCKCETVYLGDISWNNWALKDKKLMSVLLAAGKKTITSKVRSTNTGLGTHRRTHPVMFLETLGVSGLSTSYTLIQVTHMGLINP